MQPKTQKERDSQLREDVIRQLEWDPQVMSRDINVATEENVVTLTGFVHSYASMVSGRWPTISRSRLRVFGPTPKSPAILCAP